MRQHRFFFLIFAAAILLCLSAGFTNAQDMDHPAAQVIIPTILPTEDQPAEETRQDEFPQSDDASEEQEIIETPESHVAADPAALLTDETLFPLIGYTNTFYESQGYVNEVATDGIIHQFYVYYGKATDIQMSLLPASRSARNSNRFLNLEKSWSAEFHAGITLQKSECAPADTCGNCWVRYSNALLKGADSESGILLIPGAEAYAFSPVDGVVRYESIADLSFLDPAEELRLEFIRVDGVSYFYADGEFLFSYVDGIPGSVSFEAGSMINEGGNRIRCDFDDYSMNFRQGVY